MGVTHPVVPTGVFPVVPETPVEEDAVGSIASDPTGWSNYRSAEEDPANTQAILQKMVDNRWAHRCESWEEVTLFVGSTDVTLNKMALISKERPDGSVKHQIGRAHV